jgi:hypothetical protein
MRIRHFHLIAILALAAAMPSAADAAYLDAEAFPANLNGSSTTEHVFTLEAGLSVKCKKASFTGSISADTNAISLAPSFSECTAFGFAATVTTTGCQLVLRPGLQNESGKFPGTLDLSCEAGKSLVITAGTCEVQIAGQTGLANVQTANNGASPNGVTVEFAIEKATYNKTKDGFACALNGTGIKADGGLTGTSTLTGKVGAETIGIALFDKTIFCQDNLGASCDPKKVHTLPTAFTGAATDFKIVVHYDDGVVGKNVTVTCKKASLSATATKSIGFFALSHHGEIETPLETFNTETCSEDNGLACSAVEVRKVPSTGYFAAGVNGNGGWGFELKLKVSCATAAVTFTCHFAKAISFNFEGDATAAKVKAPGINIDLDKPVTGEKNCGKNPANLTATYALSVPGFLRKG